MITDSRYELANFITGEDKSYIQANMAKLKELSVNTYIIPPKHVRRLDLISYYIYGTVAFKWIFIYCNDIIDISMLDMGFKLHYPSMKDILATMSETSDFLE